MKTITKQKTFGLDHSGKTDCDTLESIFSDAIIIYDSEVILNQWVGTKNATSDLDVKFCTCRGSYYWYQRPDQN